MHNISQRGIIAFRLRPADLILLHLHERHLQVEEDGSTADHAEHGEGDGGEGGAAVIVAAAGGAGGGAGGGALELVDGVAGTALELLDGAGDLASLGGGAGLGVAGGSGDD
ncbi:unnamed protein product, partial [Clonostachys rosea f. rosea IK726]